MSPFGQSVTGARPRFATGNSNATETLLDRKGRGMKRKASAVWRGDVKTGKGSLSTESTVLEDTQYSFSSRFENDIGTNPEELLSTPPPPSFSMPLSPPFGHHGSQ